MVGSIWRLRIPYGESGTPSASVAPERGIYGCFIFLRSFRFRPHLVSRAVNEHSTILVEKIRQDMAGPSRGIDTLSFRFYSFSTPPDDQSWVKQFSLPVIALSIILLQGFSTQPAVLFSGNPAAWTLSCEAFFYFLHPLVNSRTTMKKKTAFALLTCAIGVGIVMCLLRASELVISPPLERVWEFFLGMALAHLLRAGVRFQLPPWSAYIMIAGVIAFYWLLNSRYHDHPSFFITSLHTLMPVILALIYALMIAICASADIEGRYSPLRHRFLVTGGEWSYAFYLVHATVLYSFKSFTGLIPWGVWTIPVWCVVFIIALAAAGGLHLLIEKPLERRLRRWGDSHLSPKAF